MWLYPNPWLFRRNRSIWVAGWAEPGRHLRRIGAMNKPLDHRSCASSPANPSNHQTRNRGRPSPVDCTIPSSQKKKKNPLWRYSLQFGERWQGVAGSLRGAFDTRVLLLSSPGRDSRCRCLRLEIHANWIRSCSNERILPARALLPPQVFSFFSHPSSDEDEWPFPLPAMSQQVRARTSDPERLEIWVCASRDEKRERRVDDTRILWMHRLWLFVSGWSVRNAREEREREREGSERDGQKEREGKQEGGKTAHTQVEFIVCQCTTAHMDF